MRKRLRFLFAAPLVALSFAGCGPGDGRQTFEGKVTYQGQPVAFGTVVFEPDASRGQGGYQGTADIVDGRYRTNPGFGPATGPHIARVTGYPQRPTSPTIRPLFSDVPVPVDIKQDTRTLDLEVPDQAQRNKK